MGAQDWRSSTLNYWTLTFALCLPLSLFLTKFMLHQFMSFLLLYFCNIQLKPQIIFPLRLNLLGAHGCSPGVPILLHYPPSTPRYLSKDNPINGFAFSFGERNPPRFSQPLPMYSMGTLSPLPVCWGFVWAGPGRFADLVLTSQVASVKFTSQSFHAPLPNT